MAEIRCDNCHRFIGAGNGSGTVRLQCRKCGAWQLVQLAAAAEFRGTKIKQEGK